MSSKDDGGPAFPTLKRTSQDGPPTPIRGMSLRDWFAGQALAGMIRANHRLTFAPPDDATWAYKIADAMLAERAKP